MDLRSADNYSAYFAFAFLSAEHGVLVIAGG